jgi:hypothetical protein
MTEREHIQDPLARPFVRLEIRFRDGALYCPRFSVDDEHAPQWRGAYASSSPLIWATLNDSRPMSDVGLIAGTALGKALIAAHGDIISAVAVEMVQ